jgi:hypothetical protein
MLNGEWRHIRTAVVGHLALTSFFYEATHNAYPVPLDQLAWAHLPHLKDPGFFNMSSACFAHFSEELRQLAGVAQLMTETELLPTRL